MMFVRWAPTYNRITPVETGWHRGRRETAAASESNVHIVVMSALPDRGWNTRVTRSTVIGRLWSKVDVHWSVDWELLVPVTLMEWRGGQRLGDWWRHISYKQRRRERQTHTADIIFEFTLTFWRFHGSGMINEEIKRVNLWVIQGLSL